ncbi:hypothetical protein CIB48_g4707 [Xylaria polymorpha]|nr:hypothetical protein CIB48_g4707 [Xylaria polymorpha]
MANFGNRSEMLAAINFVESHFPNSQAPKPTFPWRVHNDPPHSQPPHLPPPPPPGVLAEGFYSSVPDHPPPGLIRTDPPTPAPSRVITNETASLFGDFARYLDEGIDEDGNPVVVDLTCCICMHSKLQVSDFVTPHTCGNAPGTVEVLAVLPCGHYFGSDCLYEWLEYNTREEAGCPLCRFQLVYDCGHGLEPRGYNPLGTRREQIPMTIPEGGKVPRSCEYCFEGCIDTAIDRLRRLLFPPDVIPGDLQFPNSDEILRSTSAHFKLKVWNFLILNEHYIRW